MAGHPLQAADFRIAARLGVLRRARRVTQQRAAKHLGVSGAQFQKYEAGRNRVSGGAIQALAELLDVPVSAFFDDGEGR